MWTGSGDSKFQSQTHDDRNVEKIKNGKNTTTFPLRWHCHKMNDKIWEFSVIWDHFSVIGSRAGRQRPLCFCDSTVLLRVLMKIWRPPNTQQHFKMCTHPVKKNFWHGEPTPQKMMTSQPEKLSEKEWGQRIGQVWNDHSFAQYGNRNPFFERSSHNSTQMPPA